MAGTDGWNDFLGADDDQNANRKTVDGRIFLDFEPF
jgi:hypothetical protein